ncbi:hypothetical protein, partial [Ferrimicrobium acidiphilum]|uniref:hypothetical protein n=1 Tax=Ferrimicrobium acidiphilum TaxID=121039 RepID=UPI0023F3252E
MAVNGLKRKASNHFLAHKTGRLVVGDVRGIEKHAKAKRRMGRQRSSTTVTVVERTPGTLSPRQNWIRAGLAERIRFQQDLPRVLNTQPIVR